MTVTSTDFARAGVTELMARAMFEDECTEEQSKADPWFALCEEDRDIYRKQATDYVIDLVMSGK
jgi:hypothetical protein